MKQAVTFHLPVRKATQSADLIEVGDTVTLVISNDAGDQTTQDVTVTDVLDYGKTIQWDASTTGNLGTRHVVRVHAKHIYECPGALNYQAVLTESGGGTVAVAGVTSLVINGIVYPIDISEDAIAAGITQEFADALVAKFQAMFGSNGYVTAEIAGTAGTQTLTVLFTGTTHVPTTWVLTGLTAGAWTNP